MSTYAARDELTDLGYDVIPIAPGEKLSLSTSWPTRPPAELWRTAPSDSNLAIRHGGALRLASIEAERGRADVIHTLRRYLAGLGYDWHAYPATRTAHGGERYFFALLDAPTGSSFRAMTADMGGGECRYGPGAYALVPPSVVDGGRYELIGGAWDGALPRLEWADIAELLNDAHRSDAPPATSPANSDIAALLAAAAALPADVRKRLQGQGGTDYPSIDDYKTVYRLAALGYDPDQTAAMLLTHPGYGHFSAMAPAAAMAWLTDAHAKALAHMAAHGGDVGAHLAHLIARIEAEPWPGRTGATDKSVYLAHLSIAQAANAPIWAGAARRLADITNMGHMTATRATHRLIAAGRLVLHRAATPQLAAEYALPYERLAQTDTLLYDDHKEVYQFARARLERTLGHDVFSWHGLGKGAGIVYAALLAGPGTVTELAARSGRHPGTVRRALSKLAAIEDPITGAVICLATEEGGVWEAVDDAALLTAAAVALGVDGIGDKRKETHRRERTRHVAALESLRGSIVPRPAPRGRRMSRGTITRASRRRTRLERIGTPEADAFRLHAEAAARGTP